MLGMECNARTSAVNNTHANSLSSSNGGIIHMMATIYIWKKNAQIIPHLVLLHLHLAAPQISLVLWLLRAEGKDHLLIAAGKMLGS